MEREQGDGGIRKLLNILRQKRPGVGGRRHRKYEMDEEGIHAVRVCARAARSGATVTDSGPSELASKGFREIAAPSDGDGRKAQPVGKQSQLARERFGRVSWNASFGMDCHDL